MDGPSVWVDTTAFSVLALVFHELATNAAKYGALSHGAGRLSVSWTLTAQGDCELVWQERGGPLTTPPTRKGFGSTLISRSIPHDLGGESRLDYEPEGLRAFFRIPARNLTAARDAAPMPVPEPVAEPKGIETPPAALPLGERSILLVEDQMLIAMDAEMMLADLGFSQVVTVSSSSEALTRLRAFRPSAAVLDVNLGVDTSIAVAVELRRLGTPFVFATGYGDTSIIPAEFSDIRVVRKPYSSDELGSAILHLIGK